jgi:hypothetical protein
MSMIFQHRRTAILAGSNSFWFQRLIFDERELSAAPGSRKTLATQAVLQALGWSNQQGTSNPPMTVIGRDGTLQYATNNLLTVPSEDISHANWGRSAYVTTPDPSTLLASVGDGSHSLYKLHTTTLGEHTVAVEASAYGMSWLGLGFGDNATADGAFFDLTNGVVGVVSAGATASMLQVESGRYLCVVSRNRSVTSTYLQVEPHTANNQSESYTVATPGTGLKLQKLRLMRGAYTAQQAQHCYVPTTTSAAYGIPITHDRGASSNYARHSDAPSQGGSPWTPYGGASVSGNTVTYNAGGIFYATNFGGGGFAADTLHLVAVDVSFPVGVSYFTLAHNNIGYTGGFSARLNADGAVSNTGATGVGALTAAYSVKTATGWTLVIAGTFSSGVSGDCYIMSGGATLIVNKLALQLGYRFTGHLKTTTAVPLFSAGTPTRQNLLSTTDLTDALWQAYGNVTASALGATGPGGAQAYRLTKTVTSPSASIRNLARIVPATTYTVYAAVRAGTFSSLQIGYYTGAGFSAVAAHIVSGPGSVDSDTLPTVSGLSGSDWTVVRITVVPAGTAADAGVYLYPGAQTTGGVGNTIDVAMVMLHEGTADLPYTATSGTPISEYPQAGIQVAEQRTRETLHPRDLTQAAWVKTNVTAAKTAIGLDGAANSCTTLTASANNGTCLQSVTSASANRAFSTHVRSRSASTLTIDMTCDGGTTWQAVTVNAAFTRSSITQSSVTNPSYGFRLRASGDSIDVDFVQGEIGSFATPPIWGTESAAQTRNITNIQPPNSTITDGPMTVAMGVVSGSLEGHPVLIGAGVSASLYVSDSGSVGIWDSVNTVATTGGTIKSQTPAVAAFRWGGSAMAVCGNGGSVASGAYDGTIASTPVRLGAYSNGVQPFNGLITSLQTANKVANDTQFQLAGRGALP